MAEKSSLPCFLQTSSSSVGEGSIAMPAVPCPRERFYVELKTGETTFVSWKKLQKESQKSWSVMGPNSVDAPFGAHPALEARIAPEVVKGSDPLPPPPNRFSSMIEKIERLYQGGNSDDELSDCFDDDKYDTRDSFIDDSELNDYFSVENAKLKHDGFYVNRGKLEQEPHVPAPGVALPKKRKKPSLNIFDAESNRGKTKKLNSGSKIKSINIAKKSALSSSGAAFLPSDTDAMHKDWRVPRAPSDFKEAETCTNKAHGEALPSKDSSKEKSDRKDIVGPAGERPMAGNTNEFHNTNERKIALFDVNEPLRVDSPVMVEHRETVGTNGAKLKSVQKSVREENIKEPQTLLKKSPSSVAKDISPARTKGTVLERAFLDLEKGVAESCPPSIVSRDPEQGKRNRLPPDVKQKLAKIARLAAKQGRITDELIERLMGILGHVMRVKTLKRNLKAMIEMGLCAMQEKEGRLVGIRKEVTEMIKSRVHNLQSQEHNQGADRVSDTSAEKTVGECRYQWDHATEDKICDLYEQYIEGMDENKGPHLRKLYAELAELWPDGWMDNVGIKLAVHRAQERKKKLNKASTSSESKKRRRPALKPKMEIPDSTRQFVLHLGSNISERSPSEKTRASVQSGPNLYASSSLEHEEHRASMKDKHYFNQPNSLEKKNKVSNEKLQLKMVKGEADTEIKARPPSSSSAAAAHKVEKASVEGIATKGQLSQKSEKLGVEMAAEKATGIGMKTQMAQKSEKLGVEMATEKGTSIGMKVQMSQRSEKIGIDTAERGTGARAEKGARAEAAILGARAESMSSSRPEEAMGLSGAARTERMISSRTETTSRARPEEA